MYDYPQFDALVVVASTGKWGIESAKNAAATGTCRKLSISLASATFDGERDVDEHATLIHSSAVAASTKIWKRNLPRFGCAIFGVLLPAVVTQKENLLAIFIGQQGRAVTNVTYEI